MAYNYTIAKEALNDNDKNRLMCLYLNCETTAVNQLIDWEKAAKDFGCASVDSVKVMTRTALKKVADKGGKEGVEAKTKAAPKEKGATKKREAKGEGEEVPKKRGRMAKKVESPVVDDEEGEQSEEVVKEELAEEGDEL